MYLEAYIIVSIESTRTKLVFTIVTMERGLCFVPVQELRYTFLRHIAVGKYPIYYLYVGRTRSRSLSRCLLFGRTSHLMLENVFLFFKGF
jgi:hypothetical protein